MANLNIEQKKVKSLFQESKYNFLIPDYQRPYAWGEMECKTLWDDLVSILKCYYGTKKILFIVNKLVTVIIWERERKQIIP